MNACPRFEVIKRSICIEGARKAFARAKVHCAKMDAEKLVKEGPLEGMELRHPRHSEYVLTDRTIFLHFTAEELVGDFISLDLGMSLVNHFQLFEHLICSVVRPKIFIWLFQTFI